MRKILVIDDNLDNLTSIKALLNHYKANSTVLSARSGPEGIEIAKREKPDTILLDIIMPEMDGYEVCEKLKSDEETSNIPIIMLTAIRTDTKSRIKGLDVGADAFFSKPMDPEELSAQISVMFRIKEAEDKLTRDKNILQEKNEDLERFKNATLQREFRIKELNDKIEVLNDRIEELEKELRTKA